MFRGIQTISLDSKGRIVVPARYRLLFAGENREQIVVTVDIHEKCLLLYLLSDWQTIERKLVAMPNVNPLTRRIQRLLIGHAFELELDANGRVLLPELLREHAGLDKQVMWVGQGNKVELWGADQWQQWRKEEQTVALAQELSAQLSEVSL